MNWKLCTSNFVFITHIKTSILEAGKGNKLMWLFKIYWQQYTVTQYSYHWVTIILFHSMLLVKDYEFTVKHNLQVNNKNTKTSMRSLLKSNGKSVLLILPSLIYLNLEVAMWLKFANPEVVECIFSQRLKNHTTAIVDATYHFCITLNKNN